MALLALMSTHALKLNENEIMILRYFDMLPIINNINFGYFSH